MIELTVLNDSNVELNTVDDGLIGLDVVMATGGGGEIHNQNKTVTPTESEQSVTADVGYTGLGTVTVEGIDSEYVGSGVPRNTSSSLLTEGATVIAPSGYYENSATKTVQMGTAGTPTASKGAVSNHSVSVTPSVTNQAGYIYSETITGTAVSVSASELVSGTKSITQNGTEDVTNYASVSVSVPNSYSASDEGKVVNNGALVSQTSDTVTANDTYNTTLINSLTVNVSGGGSDWDLFDVSLPSGDITTNVTTIKGYTAYGRTGITSLKAPNCTNITGYAFQNSSLKKLFAPSAAVEGSGCRGAKKLQTAVISSAYLAAGSSQFRDDTALQSVDISASSRLEQTFNGCTNFKILVIRHNNVNTLTAQNTFTSTPFASGGSGGTLYVPQSKISGYRSATNWSTILGYANNMILPVEGSYYQTHYVDGTEISGASYSDEKYWLLGWSAERDNVNTVPYIAKATYRGSFISLRGEHPLRRNSQTGNETHAYPIEVPSGSVGFTVTSSELDFLVQEMYWDDSDWISTATWTWQLQSDSSSHSYTLTGQNTSHINIVCRVAGDTGNTGTVTQAMLDAITFAWNS